MRDREAHTSLLNELDIPVLFIAGKQDSRITPDKILPQIALPKHAEALILDGTGHMGFIEARKQTLRTLAHFGIKWF
jgi:pimeloyl-ACP methyl ester carboxylesterase